MRWILSNKPRAYGIAVVLVGWLALLSVPSIIPAGLTTILGLILGTDVHNSVMPVTKAAAAITKAAGAAAEETVRELTNSTPVGVIGEITAPAAAVVQTAVNSVVPGVLKGVGIK